MDVKYDLALWKTISTTSCALADKEQDSCWDAVFNKQRLDCARRGTASCSPPPVERTEDELEQVATQQVMQVLMAGRDQIKRIVRDAVSRNRDRQGADCPEVDLLLLADAIQTKTYSIQYFQPS